MPGFEDFQVDTSRVSFVASPERVPEAWRSIDRCSLGDGKRRKKGHRKASLSAGEELAQILTHRSGRPG